jgi:tetratricopeptide (TPR) repeat protein
VLFWPKDNLHFAKNRYTIGIMGVIGIRTGIACRKHVASCALAFALFAIPVWAQKGSTGSGGSHGTVGGGTINRPVYMPTEPGTQPNSQPGVIVPTAEPIAKPVAPEDESCLPWALPKARSTTVSATSLGVPGKARSQYEKACDAFKKKNWTDAEKYARNAIEKYSNYPAAWVMLGEVLQGEEKMDDAHDACLKPLSVDPKYLPPYLCIAGLLNLEKRWSDLVSLSDRFAGMNPTGDMYANYYRGLAHFHLHHLPEAQKSVLQAIADDGEHHQPAFNFLLAQIYGTQGDLANAALQVQEFQKYSNSKQDKDTATEYLSELQSQVNAK